MTNLRAATPQLIAVLALFLFCLQSSYADKEPVRVVAEGLPPNLTKIVLDQPFVASMRDGRHSNENDLRLLFRLGLQRITDILRAHGYYRSKVTGDYKLAQEQWQVTYRIELNEVLHYKAATATLTGDGAMEPALIQIIDRFEIFQGKPVLHADYESLKTELLRRANNLGYLDAVLQEHQINIDLAKYEAHLSINLATGPQYRFGSISIEQDLLQEQLIRRFMSIAKGDPFSFRALLAQEQIFYDTQYFREVTVTPDRDAAEEDAVPITIKMKRRNPSSYTMGLGYHTDTGIGGKFGWERRYVNDKGHHFETGIRVSEIGSNIHFQYHIPVRDPRRDQLMLFAEYKDDEPDTSSSKIGRFGVNFATAWRSLRTDYSLTYHIEEYEVADSIGKANMLIPGFGVAYSTAGDKVYVDKGLSIRASVRGSAENIVSNTSFIQTRVHGKLIYSLTKELRVLLRGELGVTGTPEFQELPASLRFFAGGDQSVRGYAYKSLGPVNSDGSVVGGRHLLVGSAEIEQEIDDKWAVAAFIDAGNAFDDFTESLKRGVGVGLRWRSPVGPVRVDVAYPLHDAEHSWRLHISIGPDL